MTDELSPQEGPKTGVMYWMWSFDKLAVDPSDNYEANHKAAIVAYFRRFGTFPSHMISGAGYFLCGPVPEGMTR